MLYAIIAFFLALIPFLSMSQIGDGFRTPKEIATILAFITITGFGCRYIRNPIRSKWLWLFLAWSFALILVNSYSIPVYLPKNVTIGMPATFFMWKPLFNITVATFAIYTLASISFTKNEHVRLGHMSILAMGMDKDDVVRNIAFVINMCVVVMCGYAIIQAIGFDDFFSATNAYGRLAITKTDSFFNLSHRVVGVVGNPSLFATWIAMCIPFSLYLRRPIGYAGVILAIITLSITWSATAIIASVVGVLAYFYFLNRSVRNIVFMSIAISLITLFVYKMDIPIKEMDNVKIVQMRGNVKTNLNKLFIKDSYIAYVKAESKKLIHRINIRNFLNPTGRIECHKEAWKKFESRRLLGMGLGTFEYLIGLDRAVVDRLGNENWRNLHDEPGQIWFETGLIGLSCFVLFCISVFVLFLKNITRETITLASSLCAFLVVCTTLFPMRVNPHAFYAVIFVGLLMNLTRRSI